MAQYEYPNHYIDGAWCTSLTQGVIDVVNPATESVVGHIAAGGEDDVNAAVIAARRAFKGFSQTSKKERIALLNRIAKCYEARLVDMSQVISLEMGAPEWLASQYQVPLGLAHIQIAIETLKAFEFHQHESKCDIISEGIGVCALISPWNWPQHQIMCKVAPAIAAGCCVIVKPSQLAPFDACLLADIMHEAKVPPGVFNLVNGPGSAVGAALARHPDVDMISFTGSQDAGIAVAQAAAPTVKRVVQELGGKSANIILDDCDLESAVSGGVQTCFLNSGQNCIAPSRMLIPIDLYEQSVAIAAATAEALTVSDPNSEGVFMGPIANEAQYHTIQKLIKRGIDEGALLVAGGLGRPKNMEKGLYARPTVFAEVHNDMEIAREEIFGPVLVLIPYKDEEDAISIANDTRFGLAAYVSGSTERARSVASRLRAGNIYINGGQMNVRAPFGGYKQSGNGREFSIYGFEEFLEVKALIPAETP